MALEVAPVLRNLPANAGDVRDNPWVGKIPWRRAWQPTPVFMPGESHGQRSLVGYTPWGYKESDKTEWPGTPHSPTRIGMESVSESRKCYGKRQCLNWVLQFKSKLGGQERETSNTRLALEMTWLNAKNRNSKKPVQIMLLFFSPGHAACGILVSSPGVEQAPPALEIWRLNHWTSREIPKSYSYFKAMAFKHFWTMNYYKKCRFWPSIHPAAKISEISAYS